MSNILFLTGTLCTEDVFSSQIEALKKLGHNCVAIDYKNSNTLTAMTKNALLELQNDQTFNICAFSMGAMVAFELLRQHPNRIERIALIAGNAHADKPTGTQIRAQHYEFASKYGLSTLITHHFKQSYLATPSDSNLARICTMAEQVGLDGYQAQLNVLATRPESIDTIADCSSPMLILAGNEDPLCPPAEQQRMHHAAKKSQLALIEKAGHFVTYEQPEVVTKHLINFFGE